MTFYSDLCKIKLFFSKHIQFHTEKETFIPKRNNFLRSFYILKRQQKPYKWFRPSPYFFSHKNNNNFKKSRSLRHRAILKKKKTKKRLKSGKGIIFKVWKVS